MKQLSFEFKLQACDFCGGPVHMANEHVGRCKQCGSSTSISGGPIPSNEPDEREPYRAQVW